MSEWHPAVAVVAAPHLQRSVEFERSQKDGLAAALLEVIEVSGFKPGPPYDEPVFMGTYSIPRLIEHVRGLAEHASYRHS